MKIKNMQVEVNKDYISNPEKEGMQFISIGAMIPPSIGDKCYWLLRVRLTNEQAIIAFPKFRTIGIGFQKEEEDWNTNKIYNKAAEVIYDWIKCNKGDISISSKDCIQAIKMIQKAINKNKEFISTLK